MILTVDIADRFATLTLGHVRREFPNKLEHVMEGEGDVLRPRVLHPIFYGSFDWHSCVHGWWQMLTLLRLFPDMAAAGAVRATANEMLVADKMAGELSYLARPSSLGFERPYGWAWALALHGEALRHDAAWGAVLEPLARVIAARFRDHLPKLTYPIRVGTHFNTSFALTLALEWAQKHDAALAGLIEERAQTWFAQDRACQAWEPGGDEFLSSALSEALLMTKIMAPTAFATWFDTFLPHAAESLPATLFTPAIISDRADGKIAHLDGLNLSRAWAWRRIAATLGEGHPVHIRAVATAEQHLEAALPHIADTYAGEHWLATFAVLALSA